MPEFGLTGSCRLRPLQEGDADELHALIETNREHLARWLAWAQRQTPQDTRRFIARAERQLQSNDGFHCAIVEQGRIVGAIGFQRIDWDNRATSIGYWLAREAQGRGTMSRAVRALVEHAFGELELNRVEIRLDVENERSRRVVERLGFRREGVLREAMRIAGAYHDDALYAMLACEWPAASATGASAASQRASARGAASSAR